jgi:hypothetical protein
MKMRRVEAIFAVILLLAMPLTLLADGGAGADGGCNRICCVRHGQPANLRDSANAKTSSEGMTCHHAGMQKNCKCAMKSSGRVADMGLFAPLPPTRPGLTASLIAPKSSRRGIAQPIRARN